MNMDPITPILPLYYPYITPILPLTKTIVNPDMVCKLGKLQRAPIMSCALMLGRPRCAQIFKQHG